MKIKLILIMMIITTTAFASSEDFYTHPEELILYNPNQTHADTIKKCVLINTDKDSCTFSDTSLIGFKKDQIEVSDILYKTIASNKSYFETFKNVLNKLPKDALVMFGAVNAVVISERINPSFYSYKSGAIYLSADYFWKGSDVSPKSESKDFRDDFGSTLNFSEKIDYYIDGQPMSKSLKRNFRTDDELLPFIAKVLFHELSHANDFFPRSFYRSSELEESKSYNETAMYRMDNALMLSQKIRLSSNLLERTADILYFGKKPTQTELNMNPKYVVEEFLEGEASDLYAYTNSREDLAMLVEHNLMYYYFNYVPATIFIKYPKANFKIPKDYKYPVLGGVKNKLAANDVKARSERILEFMFGDDFSKKVMKSLEGVSQVIIPENTSWEAIKKLK
jgi:hypothetical protein